MDYGGLNRLLGREVDQEFWGTRTQVRLLTVLSFKSAVLCNNLLRDLTNCNISFLMIIMQHIVGVAGCLALTDHASQAIFQKVLKKELCFAKSPAAFVAHTFLFIFGGVTIYCAGDAALNPTHKDEDRLSTFKNETYNSYVGSNTAWFEPYVPVAVAKVAGPAAGSSWVGGALLPATLAYTTVKGVGWNDWGNSGLNDLERKINGLEK